MRAFVPRLQRIRIRRHCNEQSRTGGKRHCTAWSLRRSRRPSTTARRRAGEPEDHSGLSLRLLLRRFLYEKVFGHPWARAADVLDPRFLGRLRRAGQGPRRRERHRRQREGGPARGAHGVPAVYRLPAHAQRAFLHQRGPSGSETVRNFNR